MQLRLRLPYLLFIIFLVPLGLTSRKFDAQLPYLYGAFAPDVLWATMIYVGIRFLTPLKSMKWAVVGALLFSYLIEVSQFYHAPWIDAIRATWLGGLVLGFSFLWSDLLCYAIGIGLGYAIDHWWIQKNPLASEQSFELSSVKE